MKKLRKDSCTLMEIKIGVAIAESSIEFSKN
jgi:hypothetical protein